MSLPSPAGVTRVVGRLLLVAAVVVGVAGLGMGPAQAGGRLCRAEEVAGVSGGVSYHVSCVQTYVGQPGGGGGGGSSGPAKDTCNLAKALATDAKMPPAAQSMILGRWCEGRRQCWGLDKPYDAEPEDLARYRTLKPPAFVLEVFCADGFITDAGGWNLYIGGVVTPRQLLARADDAYGNLRPPPTVPRTSPGTPAVVQLDTWFWLPVANFDPAAPVRGSSADGMVAIATPQTTTWEPGDGSGTVVCPGAGIPYGPGATSACTHVYKKASFSPQPIKDPKGNPAYRATVTRTYAVRYEFFGVPVVVPGARVQFAVQTPFPLAVQEVQTEEHN